jgi:hypothetical protein
MASVGPGSFDPNINAVLKVGTSKKILAKNPIPDHRDVNEPGPGAYDLPDSFKIETEKKKASGLPSRKEKHDPAKIT